MKRASNREATGKADVAEHFTSVADVYNQRNYVLAGKRGKYPDIALRHRYFLEMLEGSMLDGYDRWKKSRSNRSDKSQLR